MENCDDNMKFVVLVEEFKIILGKSQNSVIKKAKLEAVNALINKWTLISGKKLTHAAVSKKISNLKVRSKTASSKGYPLSEWQVKLLEITKVNKMKRRQSF